MGIKRLNKYGFTLLEVIVVVAILAILTAVAIPVISNTINSATLSTAKLNAGTIDKDLKQAKAYVDVGDDSYYGESIKTRTLTVRGVIEKRALQKACKSLTYDNREIVFVWSKAVGGVRIMYADDCTDLETGLPLSNYEIIDESNTTLIANLG